VLGLFLFLSLAGLFWGIAGTPPAEIRGQVRDATGPVVGAAIRYKGTSTATRTGPDGSFCLPAGPPRDARITAAREGYYITGISAAASPLVLTLTPLSRGDNEKYQWIAPAPDVSKPKNCGNCHEEIFRE
jgi:hypothetical protein